MKLSKNETMITANVAGSSGSHLRPRRDSDESYSSADLEEYERNFDPR